MGCSSCSELLNIIEVVSGIQDSKLSKRIKLKTRPLPDSITFTQDRTIRKISLLKNRLNISKNFDLYVKIFEENDRLVALLKKKISELSLKTMSNVIMIGKADCGKPCYAYNRTLFKKCPECGREAKERMENGTDKKQVLDRETGQYKWEEL